MIGSLLRASELGLIPDYGIRFGVRTLLRQRLRTLNHAGSQSFISSLPMSPIALVPEKANDQHYELPPDFFELVLGEYGKYSSGYWDGATDLADAELAMLKLTAARADLRDGQTILELGCGWGSLLLFAAKRYPGAKFTGVSNSNPQRQYILDQAKARGLSNVEVITADMNTFEIEKRFDRIISIEMFEHMRNYSKLFAKIGRWLEADGKFFLHIFTHKQFAYPFEEAGEDNWMGRHFFSGGMMPSVDLPLKFQEHLKLSKRWKVSGTHYSKTCEAWLSNHDMKRSRVMSLFRQTYGSSAWAWFNRWRIFFIACSELFNFRNGDEWFVSHYLFSRREVDA